MEVLEPGQIEPIIYRSCSSIQKEGGGTDASRRRVRDVFVTGEVCSVIFWSLIFSATCVFLFRGTQRGANLTSLAEFDPVMASSVYRKNMCVSINAWFTPWLHLTFRQSPSISKVDGDRGKWLYRGYMIGDSNGNLSGRWRDTLTSPHIAGYEGCFVMSRRKWRFSSDDTLHFPL